MEDRFYIYLEYVHPGSISKYVREHCGAMTESVVRNFTRHILSGLAYLHSKKTIHRYYLFQRQGLQTIVFVIVAVYAKCRVVFGLSFSFSSEHLESHLLLSFLQGHQGSKFAC